jgi:hypothetical protein
MHWKDKEITQTKAELAQAHRLEGKKQDDVSSGEVGDKLTQVRGGGPFSGSEDSGSSGDNRYSESNDQEVSLGIKSDAVLFS